MVKITRVYTRTGDDGSTGLADGSRVPKDSSRVEAYGEIDELNTIIGWARTIADESKNLSELSKQLASISNDLFDLGAELATPNMNTGVSTSITQSRITELESWMDKMNEDLPELRSFILPGGTQLNSVLHLARAVCRRAERSIVSLNRNETIRPEVIGYVNRLSDLLFVMSRASLKAAGKEEFLWVPGGKK